MDCGVFLSLLPEHPLAAVCLWTNISESQTDSHILNQSSIRLLSYPPYSFQPSCLAKEAITLRSR